MAKLKILVFIAMISFLLIIIPVNSQGLNKTIENLNQSRKDIQEMVEAGFSVSRVNDTLNEAEQLFDAQYALMKSGGTPDFSLILERTSKITDLRKLAEDMSDELKALEARLKELGDDSEAYPIFYKAKEEFADERYDKVADLIEEAYTKISEEKAVQTRFRAIYVASTKTLTNFVQKRWKEISGTVVFISFIYFFSRKRIALFLINRKINELNFEKEVLGKLTKKAQYEYFHLFKIPEELYHIRIAKYGELIRDIDRQVPLLVEEKERLKGKAEEEVKTDKAKKFHKKLVVIAALSIAFIAAGIFLITYFKLVSYNEILVFIQKLGLNAIAGLSLITNFIINTFGVFALVATIFAILLIFSAIFVFLYIRKRKKAQKPELEQEQRFRFKFLQSLQISILNKINRLKFYFKNLINRIEVAKQYNKLLKQKREEEKLRIKYLRKQKLILLKRNLEQKFHSVLRIFGFRREEKKVVEVPKVTILDRIKYKINEWKQANEDIRKKREEERQRKQIEEERKKEALTKQKKQEQKNRRLEKERLTRERKRKIKEFFSRIRLHKTLEKKKRIGLQKKAEEKVRKEAKPKKKKEVEKQRTEEEVKTSKIKKLKKTETTKKKEPISKEKLQSSKDLLKQKSEETRRSGNEQKKQEPLKIKDFNKGKIDKLNKTKEEDYKGKQISKFKNIK